MRKTILILLATAVAAFWGTAAMAGITGTAHDLDNPAGPCAECHLPHGAVQGGDRLWPSTAVTGTITNVIGEVSPLCAYCHLTNGGAVYTAPISDLYVYGNLSHGVKMGAAASWEPSVYRMSGLPYQDDANDMAIECTTCHNVHDDPTSTTTSTAEQPFLRAHINVLCSACHGNRRFESGVESSGISTVMGAWGTSVGMDNPGSHPVGTDITGNYTGDDSPVTLAGNFAAAFDGSADGWDLGGHLTAGDTGGVNCISCHAVHGVQADTTGTWDGSATLIDTEPTVNFLVEEQASVNFPGERGIANGNGEVNYLCEACHTGTAPNATAYPGANASNGTYYQNPGGTEFGHPVDDMTATIGWVAAFPAEWPSGDAAIAATNVAPVPICESCHVPHPLADQGRTDDPNNTFVVSDYILRNTSAAICADCHSGTYTAAGNRHHPVGIGFDSANVNYLANVSGAADTLECGTCHGGGGSGGAHNWNGVGALAMDPAWIPFDNARASTMADDMYDARMSVTCIDCHYGIDGDATTKSPTLHDGLIYNGTGEGSFYTIGNSTGTHYIGQLQSSWTSLGATLDPEAETWGAAIYGGVGAWSRWGGSSGSPIVVCESCHELQPSKNFDNSHLLVGAFVEEDVTVADSRSNFCEGCHLPPGTHPMTGDTVTRHEPDSILDTLYTEPWLDAPADTNVVMDDGSSIINCDSCHQVHDANDNSYTFILDTKDANIGAGVGVDTANAIAGSYDATYVTDEQTSPGGPHDAFCNECHRYQ